MTRRKGWSASSISPIPWRAEPIINPPTGAMKRLIKDRLGKWRQILQARAAKANKADKEKPKPMNRIHGNPESRKIEPCARRFLTFDCSF